MVKRFLAGFAVLMFLAASLSAQAAKITVNIPFEFYADGKAHAAGHYEITETPNSPNQLRFANLDNRSDSGFFSVLTRLSQTQGEETRVVFDKVGDKSYLAEIHVAGTDGFDLKGAPGPHTHVTVKAK